MGSFVSQLDTPGGHMLICIVLIALGASLWKLGVPRAEEMITGATAVIFMAMRGNGVPKA